MLPPLSPQRNRSTTRTKVYLCLSEPSRICSNQWRSKQLQGTFGRTPSRTKMVAKVWLTYQTDTFQVTIKPGKKTCYDFLQASKVRGFKIQGGNSIQVCLESAHKHHGTHRQPLTLHLTPAPAAWASSSAYQGLAR